MADQKPTPNTDESSDASEKSIQAGIADETAAYDKARKPVQGGDEADEAEAQPS